MGHRVIDNVREVDPPPGAPDGAIWIRDPNGSAINVRRERPETPPPNSPLTINSPGHVTRESRCADTTTTSPLARGGWGTSSSSPRTLPGRWTSTSVSDRRLGQPVGREPLRDPEALSRLAAEGLVKAEDQRGSRVSPASIEDLSANQCLREVRALLRSPATRHVKQCAAPSKPWPRAGSGAIATPPPMSRRSPAFRDLSSIRAPAADPLAWPDQRFRAAPAAPPLLVQPGRRRVYWRPFRV
jgi:hypothetical protein